MTAHKTETLYKEISELSSNEKMTLLAKLISELSSALNTGRKLDICDIKGVGKELWEGLDAQEYVTKERKAWQ